MKHLLLLAHANESNRQGNVTDFADTNLRDSIKLKSMFVRIRQAISDMQIR